MTGCVSKLYPLSPVGKEVEGRENWQSLGTVGMSLVLGVIVLHREADEPRFLLRELENSDPEAIQGTK